MTRVRPYGDWTDDGKVQLSFTLPIATGEKGRQTALALMAEMGFERPMIVHMKEMGPEQTFFVAYGSTKYSVDPDEIQIAERDYPLLSPERIDLTIREVLKRPLSVAGACTGTDAHTVGLDAILSMKGFAGDKGLEYYHEIQVINMGSQVDPAGIVAVVEEMGVDAVLISQVVTQREAHIHHLVEVRESLETAGLRDRVVLVGGGPRFSPEQATELGYDRIFGRGTKPSEVASYLAWMIARRAGRAA